eukprot:5556249-Pyramimonas_sp.AAC.1
MGSQERALGRTEYRCRSERIGDVDSSMRRPHSLNLPRRQASKTVFYLTEGDSPGDSLTKARGQTPGGRHGTAKTSAEGPPDL